MAHTASSPAARLRKLESALERARKLKRGTKLTSQPMRELLGVSWPILRDWCRDIAGFEESGAFTRGGNGIEWAFSPVQTIKFLIAHFEREQKASARKAKAIRQTIGGDALRDIPEEYDLQQISQMVTLAAKLREESERRGELVNAEVAKTAIREMMTTMQQAGLKAAREQDPTGQFEPAIAEKFENAVNSILIAMEQAGRSCLNGLRGGSSKPA